MSARRADRILDGGARRASGGGSPCATHLTREEKPSRDATLAGIPRVIAVVAASSPTHISAALSKTFAVGDNARHLFPVSLPLETIVAGLNELQPTVVMGYSSFLPRLALEAQRGRLRMAKQVIRDTWGAPVANGYAMSEGMFTGSCGASIHLPDDLCIVEPVDADGRPVGPGELSHRILVTNLYNHTQPLIRYEVTDQITLIDEPCAGRAFGGSMTHKAGSTTSSTTPRDPASIRTCSAPLSVSIAPSSSTRFARRPTGLPSPSRRTVSWTSRRCRRSSPMHSCQSASPIRR